MNTAISAYVGGLPLGVSISPYTEFPQAQTYINNTLSGGGAFLPLQRRRKLMQGSASQQATVSFLIAFQAGAPASAATDIQSAVASAIAPLTATISSVAMGAGERCSCSAPGRLAHDTLLYHVHMLGCQRAACGIPILSCRVKLLGQSIHRRHIARSQCYSSRRPPVEEGSPGCKPCTASAVSMACSQHSSTISIMQDG